MNEGKHKRIRYTIFYFVFAMRRECSIKYTNGYLVPNAIAMEVYTLLNFVCKIDN